MCAYVCASSSESSRTCEIMMAGNEASITESDVMRDDLFRAYVFEEA